MLTALGLKEAEMRLIGCDLHASQQSIAMLDRDTGVVVEKTLRHEGETVRTFYASIPPPVVVGIEATGSMGWFLRLMEELAISAASVIPRRFGRRRRAGRNTIAAMRRCCFSCWRRIGFRRSGCRPPSAEISDLYSCTAVGPDADPSAERAPRDRAGPRRAARPHVMES